MVVPYNGFSTSGSFPIVTGLIAEVRVMLLVVLFNCNSGLS